MSKGGAVVNGGIGRGVLYSKESWHLHIQVAEKALRDFVIPSEARNLSFFSLE
jgi:hypothetical protein